MNMNNYITEYELEEYLGGEWSHIKSFDNKRDALEEMEWHRKSYPEMVRVVQRKYKVIYEA